jgi:hypothetical protein
MRRPTRKMPRPLQRENGSVTQQSGLTLTKLYWSGLATLSRKYIKNKKGFSVDRELVFEMHSLKLSCALILKILIRCASNTMIIILITLGEVVLIWFLSNCCCQVILFCNSRLTFYLWGQLNTIWHYDSLSSASFKTLHAPSTYVVVTDKNRSWIPFFLKILSVRAV